MAIKNIFKIEEEVNQKDRLVTAIDQYVGSKVKMQRCAMGFTQEYVAETLGISFQQIQKYEKGINRIGAGRLWRLASILGVPVSYFYEGITSTFVTNALTGAPCLCDNVEEEVPFEFPPRANKASTELLRAFSRIKDPIVAKNILNLVKSCAAQYEKPKKEHEQPEKEMYFDEYPINGE